MKILFQGIYTDSSLSMKIQKKYKTFPYAQQKFEALLLDGFKLNGEDITILSTTPILRWPSNKKLWVNYKDEDDLKHIYLKFLNLPVLKQITILFSQFINFRMWNKANLKEDKVYLIYGTNPLDICLPIIFKKIFNFKLISIVSEINEFRNFDESNLLKRLKKRIYIYSSKRMIKKIDGYILFSRYMNSIINNENKPSMVVEAICSNNLNNQMYLYIKKKKRIVYAGSLMIKYGIKKLVDAFLQCNFEDCILEIYGNGDYVNELINISKNNSCIIYGGVKTNEEIMEIERNAYLLINPRPSTETLTKYSFPSKIIEYFTTGTASLITKLEGIPLDYYNYCFTFDDESIEGMAEMLKKVLSLDVKQLEKMGLLAKRYVLENKNSIIQSKRIIKFMHDSFFE